MNDNFTKFILVGILLCLIIIAYKPTNDKVFTSNPNINVNTGEQVIQLAPNRIAVIDNKSNSGMGGTVLVFDYDSTTKKFNYVASMNYADYFRNPSKYGVPTN
ncbi:MAG: hypothetical protein ABRQ25_05770 [Clostridiaceae bacterium]